MRRKLNADGHDESEYLPKKWFNPKTQKEEPYPIVNSFRAKKGDVVMLDEDGGVHKALKWLPDILHRTLDENAKELLTGDHVHICESIFRIACSAKVALGIADLRNYSLPVDTSESITVEVDKLFALLKGLLPYQSNLCLWVVFDEYNRGNVVLAKKIISSICSSLDNAKKILDECKQIA